MLSTFGVMFAPDHAGVAAELLRVCRPGGRIGLANWTPDGFIGQLFKVAGPPRAAARRRAAARAVGHARRTCASCSATRSADPLRAPRIFNFRYRSAAHFIEVFRDLVRPGAQGVRARCDGRQRGARAADITALLDRLNLAGAGSLVVPGEYLEVVITRKG